METTILGFSIHIIVLDTSGSGSNTGRGRGQCWVLVLAAPAVIVRTQVVVTRLVIIVNSETN